MIHPDTHNRTATFCGTKGLLFMGNQLIIIRRDNNTTLAPCLLDLPGGTREGNESPFETFAREIQEELGLTISKEDIIFSKPYPDVFYARKECFIVATRALPIQEHDIRFGSEGLGFYVMSPDEFITASDAIAGYQQIVTDVLRLRNID